MRWQGAWAGGERRAHLEGAGQLLCLLAASLDELQQLLGAVSGARNDRDQQLQGKSQIFRLYVTHFLQGSQQTLNCMFIAKDMQILTLLWRYTEGCAASHSLARRPEHTIRPWSTWHLHLGSG